MKYHKEFNRLERFREKTPPAYDAETQIIPQVVNTLDVLILILTRRISGCSTRRTFTKLLTNFLLIQH